MDTRAKQILLKAYWGSSGWKNGEVSDEDFEYCKQHGVMFEKRTFKHAEIVRRTIAARDSISPQLVGQAFVSSLSSRNLWLRSAVGSYSNCLEVKPHRFRPNPFGDMQMYCEQCGSLREDKLANLNTLNFERIKWGGVRHHDILYNCLDLELLAQEPAPLPTPADRKMHKQMLQETRASALAQETSGKLKQRWKSLIPSNPQELDALFCMLSVAEILEVDGRKVVGINEDRLGIFFN